MNVINLKLYYLRLVLHKRLHIGIFISPIYSSRFTTVPTWISLKSNQVTQTCKAELIMENVTGGPCQQEHVPLDLCA